jgi:hypothetical protein
MHHDHDLARPISGFTTNVLYWKAEVQRRDRGAYTIQRGWCLLDLGDGVMLASRKGFGFVRRGWPPTYQLLVPFWIVHIPTCMSEEL